MPLKLKLLTTIDLEKIMTPIVNGMRPIHPGEILREEFLIPFGLTPHALAIALQVPAPRIYEIVRGKRALTADTALRLSRYFGVSAEFWLGLQSDYEMAIVRDSLGDALTRIHQYMPRAV